MSSFKSRVLIADDHVHVAERCKRLLEPEFAVVGIVANGGDLVSSAIKLKPDLILVDVAMPVLNGISAASQVKAASRDIKIVYLTMNSDPEIAMDAFDRGASGFVLKTSAAAELVLAVRTALRGGTYMCPTLMEAVEHLRWERVTPTPAADRLTARQREVLQLLAQGKQMKEVGEDLQVTTRTEAFHKYQIMARIGAKSNADLVKYALRNGMVVAYQSETLSAQDNVLASAAA